MNTLHQTRRSVALALAIIATIGLIVFALLMGRVTAAHGQTTLDKHLPLPGILNHYVPPQSSSCTSETESCAA